MSAILSVDDLNDFISPGVACIKPVETLPAQKPDSSNAYEVTTEDKIAAQNAPPAQISLTDCLACSGCVTSAEAVLVSLQSHAEVLNTLDAYAELPLPWTSAGESVPESDRDGKIFVASVSPQTRASIAATYNVSEKEAGNMITQLLSGPLGLRSGGAQNSGFTWVLDTNTVREMALVTAAEEVAVSLSDAAKEEPKKPILASACPGWICYAEKAHPHVLPHISRLKSPQALAGTLIKSVLSRQFGVPASKIWHLAVMPCFDKKLEASREELTDICWDKPGSSNEEGRIAIRDVDCVITARELLMLSEARQISFPSLSRSPLRRSEGRTPFPDPVLDRFLFPRSSKKPTNGTKDAGTSGGYLQHILQTHLHTIRKTTPTATIKTTRGRNVDVVDYEIFDPASEAVLFRTARYYGFRNIQNLVRRLKPAKISRLPGAAARVGARKPGAARGAGPGAPAAAQNMSDYAFIEVMACPGGCTNGGGQIKVGDVNELRGQNASEQSVTGIENGGEQVVLPAQKEWLVSVDEAYFSASSNSASEAEDEGDVDVEMNGAHDDEHDGEEEVIDNISHTHTHVNKTLHHWARITGVQLDHLVYTTYRKVESDVGKSATDVERVVGLASSIGGGW
ncbi:iron hydrogenase [Delphinella strobiligena]|nr:iron hydrogenase [Delphinella strobiligena]